MKNIEAIIPVFSTKDGVNKKKKNKLLIKKKLIKKKLAELDKSNPPTYGADGKINNPEKIGKLINSNL